MSDRRSGNGEPIRKSRRGSETRKRNRQVKLSLLPVEDSVMTQLAVAAGHQNLQQFILAEFIEPRMRAAQAAGAAAS